MPLHLIKLAVGIETPEHLAERQVRFKNAAGNYQHTTRMRPRRETEVLDGGSLYWVIKRMITVRQEILGLHETTGADGKSYCLIELKPDPILVQPRRKRPFQGWRYLKAEDAPPDLGHGMSEGYVDPEMPVPLRRELQALGLL